MQTFYRVLANYPSGLKLPITVSPGNSHVVCERAVDAAGVPLCKVTLDEADEGGYVCLETGHTLQLKRYKLPLILNMERAIFYVGMLCKNKLGLFAAEWPIEVTPLEEYIPEIRDAELNEEGHYIDASNGVINALHQDPSKIKPAHQTIIV